MKILSKDSRHYLVKQVAAAALVATLFGGAIQSFAASDPFSHSIDISKDNNRQETRVQRQINKLDDVTQEMMEEYLRLNRELDALTRYNTQLDRMVGSQENEKRSIQEQMVELDQTQREIIPLMLDMVQWLTTLRDGDLPFLQEERRLRITQLHALMDRADVSLGEKYRRVVEAYQVEMEYGRTIEAYRDELKAGDDVRTVDFFRVGRVGLYYLTLDRKESGYWNSSEGRWTALPGRYNLQIRNGLRIARKQAAPDLLRLPVIAPQEARQP